MKKLPPGQAEVTQNRGKNLRACMISEGCARTYPPYTKAVHDSPAAASSFWGILKEPVPSPAPQTPEDVQRKS